MKPCPSHSSTSIWANWRMPEMPLCSITENYPSQAGWQQCIYGGLCTGMNKSAQERGFY